MARTPLMNRLIETLRPASAAADARPQAAGLSRRQVLAGAVALGSTVATATGCSDAPGAAEAANVDQRRASVRGVTADIGIVGAGIAGLACAYELKRAGVTATLHEAATRTGGRIWSMGGAFSGPVSFPGQVIERGGELIDTPHKAMLGYAREFGLALEDITKPLRDTRYLFDGALVPEATMVEEYRVLVEAMRDDLRLSSGGPTADSFNAHDAYLDSISLAEYLALRGAPPNIRKLLTIAYTIEYGIDVTRQSALAFLLFAKASKQSKLRLWGNFSDERYHVVGGNQQIVDGIAARLPGQIRLGRRLVAARKTPAGRVELTFKEGNKTVTATHDAVVFALPFNILRDVALDASLGLSATKRYAIDNTVYGTNAKLMVGFAGRPWVDVGANGSTYSDLPYLQASWETNPSNASATRAVITDYAGGALGASLSTATTQGDAERFVTAFDAIFPGAKAKVRRDASGKIVAHVQAWPSDPNTKGSYTANAIGYFTRIAGQEGKAAGNLYFAGETTDSFYSWQGFMEGGALSGIRAMNEIVRDWG